MEGGKSVNVNYTEGPWVLPKQLSLEKSSMKTNEDINCFNQKSINCQELVKGFRDKKDKELMRGQINLYLLFQWTDFSMFIITEYHLSCLNNNTSSCQLKDLSDMKCVFAIREDGKEQAGIVGYTEICVGRTEVVPECTQLPELRLNNFTALLLCQQVLHCSNTRPKVKGIKHYFYSNMMNYCL